MNTTTVLPKYRGFEFRSVQKIEISGEWPQYALISHEILRDSLVANKSENDTSQTPLIIINEDGHIVIRVSNGSAIYKLDREQTNTYGLCLVKESES